MANVIEILIKANNKASAELAKVDKSLMGVGKAAGASAGGIKGLGTNLDNTLKSLTGFGLGTFTAIGAITSLIGSFKKVINETVEYKIEIKKHEAYQDVKNVKLLKRQLNTRL